MSVERRRRDADEWWLGWALLLVVLLAGSAARPDRPRLMRDADGHAVTMLGRKN